MVRSPVAIGLHGDSFGMVEATRCIGDQLAKVGNPPITDLWLTHAHLGHIEGLGQFGRESVNLKNVRLHCSDSVLDYVKSHAIWEKLFDRGNFSVGKYYSEKVIPIKVPHRAQEFDTHALLFKGNNNNIFFLPDHDTWKETLSLVEHSNPRDWFKSMEADIVLLDGTFWSDDELKSRIQTDVPHPTVSETLKTLNIAKENNYTSIISHRSGETEDTFISHLAVGACTGQIKIGAPARSERTSKYNEILRIAEHIGIENFNNKSWKK